MDDADEGDTMASKWLTIDHSIRRRKQVARVHSVSTSATGVAN
jgi:hypothetical protein